MPTAPSDTLSCTRFRPRSAPTGDDVLVSAATSRSQGQPRDTLEALLALRIVRAVLDDMATFTITVGCLYARPSSIIHTSDVNVLYKAFCAFYVCYSCCLLSVVRCCWIIQWLFCPALGFPSLLLFPLDVSRMHFYRPEVLMLPVVNPLPFEVCMSKPPVPMALVVWNFPRSRTIRIAVLDTSLRLISTG